MRIILFFFLFFCQFSLGAKDIETSYKKALHKRSFHHISEIDYIYVINSKNDLKKFRDLKKRFKKFGITPYRYNASESYNLSYNTLSNVGLHPVMPYDVYAIEVERSGKNWGLCQKQQMQPGFSYFNEFMKVEDIARNIDFLSVIYDAYKSRYKTVWIMEDDVNIVVNPNILTGYLIQMKMKHPNWDVLYTDLDSKDSLEPHFSHYNFPIRPDFRFENTEFYEGREKIAYPISKVGLRRGAHSFILNRKAMKKILDYYHKYRFFIPFSVELQLIPSIKLYSLRDEVVTN